MRYEATFTPEPDDVVVGYRMRNHLGDGWWKLGTVATIFILAMMGLMAWLMEFVAFGIMVAVLLPVIFVPRLMEMNVRRTARHLSRAVVQVCFTDDGVEVTTNVGHVKHAWNRFGQVCLDDRGIFLAIDSMRCFFIPARAFPHGGFPKNEFRTLLAQRSRQA